MDAFIKKYQFNYIEKLMNMAKSLHDRIESPQLWNRIERSLAGDKENISTVTRSRNS
mgnify:CR=1 FL=1